MEWFNIFKWILIILGVLGFLLGITILIMTGIWNKDISNKNEKLQNKLDNIQRKDNSFGF